MALSTILQWCPFVHRTKCRLLRMACVALLALGSPSLLASSLAISLLCLQLYWTSHPLFLSCSGFLVSLCTCYSLCLEHCSLLWQNLFVTYSKFTLSFPFAYRILEILGLRESAFKPWSRGGSITQFWLIICTRKSHWNVWKDFSYLLRGRHASENSQPHVPLAFFPRNWFWDLDLLRTSVRKERY